MKPLVLTHEAKEKLQGCYVISDVRMLALGNPVELTEENFKVLWINNDNVLMELTAKDFRWYDSDYESFTNAKDFVFTNAEDYVIRKYIPQEVAVFLDKVIKERMAIEDD